MRKTTMLGLSTIALCLGVLIGAVGNSSHGRGVIKAAHADTKGNGSGSNTCPGGALPHCAACDSTTHNCYAACSGGALCTIYYGNTINTQYCQVDKTACLSGSTTQIGGGGSGGPVLTIGR